MTTSTHPKARPVAGSERAGITGHPEPETVGDAEGKVAPAVWAVTRLAVGFVFLWAFVDKILGLGYATPSERAWINGGSPTAGFLGGVEGPLAGVFTPIAGQGWADWLFMLGLLGIGAALMAGVAMRIAAVSGAVMLVLMWLAVLPIANNPFLDDHLVYALVVIGLAASNAGRTLGLGRTWEKLALVQRYPVLR